MNNHLCQRHGGPGKSEPKLKKIGEGVFKSSQQIHQSMSYSFMANMNPSKVLHSGWLINLISSIAGDSTLTIGFTGGLATLASDFVQKSDDESLVIYSISVICAGFLTCIYAIFNKYLNLKIQQLILIGYSNCLALLILKSQISSLKDPDGNFIDLITFIIVLFYVYLTILIMKLLPNSKYDLIKSAPPCLVSISVITFFEICIFRKLFDIKTWTVGDISFISSEDSSPQSFLINSLNSVVELNQEGLAQKIIKQTLSAFGIIIFEFIMRIQTSKNENNSYSKEITTIGLGNVVCGVMGTSGVGAANNSKGGNRISLFIIAILYLLVLMFLFPFINLVPMGALIGKMVFSFISSFKWCTLYGFLMFYYPKKEEYQKEFKCGGYSNFFILLGMAILSIIYNLMIACFFGIIIYKLLNCITNTELEMNENEEIEDIIENIIDPEEYELPENETELIKDNLNQDLENYQLIDCELCRDRNHPRNIEIELENPQPQPQHPENPELVWCAICQTYHERQPLINLFRFLLENRN